MSQENMTTSAGRPLDCHCIRDCGRVCPPEYVEPVMFNGRPITGTGVWIYPWQECPDCALKRDAAESIARAKVQAEARKADLLAMLGGPKAEGFTLETFKSTPGSLSALQEARTFDPKASNLYLWGPCGTGKTHLAGGIAAKWHYEGARVEFWKPPALMRSLRVKDPNDQEERIERLARAAVFVLDDLGVGMATEFYNQVLYEIIDKRDMNRRNGMVITSNLSLAALSEKLQDDRLASRIAGMCKVVKIDGKDWRVG